jgi:hypothetical protein
MRSEKGWRWVRQVLCEVLASEAPKGSCVTPQASFCRQPRAKRRAEGYAHLQVPALLILPPVSYRHPER